MSVPQLLPVSGVCVHDGVLFVQVIAALSQTPVVGQLTGSRPGWQVQTPD